jgi:hypothetical protein
MAGRVAGGESRMLVDVKLVPASDGATTYDYITPVTEVLLGRVAEHCLATTIVAYVAG